MRVTVRAMEADALTELAWPGFDVSAGRNYQIAIFGWSAPVNAQANLRGLLHGDPAKGTLNLSGYQNDEADTLVDAASVTTDEAERRALLYAAQERLAADLPRSQSSIRTASTPTAPPPTPVGRSWRAKGSFTRGPSSVDELVLRSGRPVRLGAAGRPDPQLLPSEVDAG